MSLVRDRNRWKNKFESGHVQALFVAYKKNRNSEESGFAEELCEYAMYLENQLKSQLKAENDRLKQQLRTEGDRIAELRQDAIDMTSALGDAHSENYRILEELRAWKLRAFAAENERDCLLEKLGEQAQEVK